MTNLTLIQMLVFGMTSSFLKFVLPLYSQRKFGFGAGVMSLLVIENSR